MKRLYLAIINKFFPDQISLEDSLVFYNGIRKSILVQAVSYLFIFGSSVLMVKSAGVSNYGIYVNIFNWINLLTIISCFGMEDVVLAIIPIELKHKNNRGVVSIVSTANRTIFFISLVCVSVFIGIVFSGIVPVFNQYKNLLVLAIVNVYLGAFIIVNQQTLQAFNRFYVSQAIDKILKPFLLIVLLSFFWFADKYVDAEALIIFNTGTLLICCGVVFYFVKTTLNKLPTEDILSVKRPAVFRDNLYFLLISVIVLLKSRIIMLILGSLNETDQVGIFNIASRLADFVLLPYLLIHAVVPQLFARHKESDTTYRKNLFLKSNLLTLIGAVPIMLVFVFLGQKILRFYNPQLEQYYGILLVLCGSQLLYSLFGPSTSLLMMQGKQKQAALAMLVDIVFNCLLFFLLIGWLGLMGAAWASFAGSLSYNILMRLLVNRFLTRGKN